MAYTLHIHLLLPFLALTACLEIQFAQGRLLKETNKRESSPTETKTGLEIHHKHNLQVHGQKKVSPPVTPPTQSREFSSAKVSHEDTFQPTAPGNSPGVGHSLAGQMRSVQPHVQHFTTFAGKADGFQPTTPGHSPGVGHSVGNLKAGPNA